MEGRGRKNMKRVIKTPNLDKQDKEVARLNVAEEERQFFNANFTASENHVSPAIREANTSVATNKYSEGYSGARYYKGNVVIDQMETLAEDRGLELFELKGDEWGVNVQPTSGSGANLAPYGALLKPKNHPDGEDVALGMRLDFGGHLTHGFHVSFSGKLFHFEQYGLDEAGYINYDEVDRLCEKFKPKLIVCGASSYSRIIDFEKFGAIAKKHGALLMADVAHIAGLIAGGAHPSPFPYCDIVTTTTHKTLRGPRGALIFARKDVMVGEKSLFQLIRSAVFPGLQGGPHNQQTLAIAVCLKEAKSPQFKTYARNIVKNAKALSDALLKHGFNIVSGGTDNHLVLLDLTPFAVSGEDVSTWLEQAGIVVNKNVIPNDPRPPREASGIRLGTPALTTRGMGTKEMKQLAKWIHEAISDHSEKNLSTINKQVRDLCKRFPPPGF